MLSYEKEAELDSFYKGRISELKEAIESGDSFWAVMQSDILLENFLRDAIVSKKVLSYLKRGKEAEPKELEEKLKTRPIWMLLIDSQILNIISKEQARIIARLRKESEMVVKSFGSEEAINKLKKEYYDKWLRVLTYISKESVKSRKEWKKYSKKYDEKEINIKNYF